MLKSSYLPPQSDSPKTHPLVARQGDDGVPKFGLRSLPESNSARLGEIRIFTRRWVISTSESEMNLTDEGAAIERCKNGDREAFAVIVQKYMRPAYYLALGYVGSPDDA